MLVVGVIVMLCWGTRIRHALRRHRARWLSAALADRPQDHENAVFHFGTLTACPERSIFQGGWT
jgi:hypothetical protein